MRTRGLLAAVLAIVSLSGHAKAEQIIEKQVDEKFSLSVGVTTAGVSVEAAYRVLPKWAVRGFIGGGITVFGKGDVAGIDYDWRARLGGGGLLIDYYPFKEGLRFSGGLVIPDTFALARAEGDLRIGDNEYLGARLKGNVETRSDVLPVLAVGYVQPLYENLSVKADLGVIFTDGFVASFDAAGGTAVDPEDLRKESAQFRDQAWEVFPFIGLSLSYRF